MGFAQLMYTVDDSDDEETTVVLLDARSRAAQLATAGLLHQTPVLSSLLGAEGELGKCVQEHEAGGAKLSQLLMQWIVSPETERYLTLLLSNARRNLLPARKAPPHRNGGAPRAPPIVQRRWSTGTTPGRGAWAAAGSPRRAARRRRRSEPVMASSLWVPLDQGRRARDMEQLSPGGSLEGRARAWSRGVAFDDAPSEASHWRRLSGDSLGGSPTSQIDELRGVVASPRRAGAGGGERWVWREAGAPSARDATPKPERLAGGGGGDSTAEQQQHEKHDWHEKQPVGTPPPSTAAAAPPVALTPPPPVSLPPDGVSPHRVSPPPRSPLYYFGKAQGNAAGQTPKSGGGDARRASDEGAGLAEQLRTAFAERAGTDGLLAPDALALLGTTLLDLPKAVAHLMVRRVQASMTPPAAPSGGVTWEAFGARYGRGLLDTPGEEDTVRLFRVVRGAKLWLERCDVEELCWAVADTHSGLEFLRDSQEFRAAYVETVALRIMWGLGGSGAQRISLQRWRRSSLPDVLFQLDEEGDINLVRDFFSYNHFYVIWCLFWELDEDEDSLLHVDDLLRYGSYSLTSRVVERIWALRLDRSQPGMKYADFALFLLAEEDKQAPSSVRYWFHVLDQDGDGVITTADMRYFYEEQQRRLEAMGEEVVSLEELLNEFNDMVAPERPSRFRLAELQKCGLAFNVLSALTNVRKYVAWEGLACEKAAGRASNLRDTRDWDLFADREYRRLVDAEEEEGADGDGDDGDGDGEP